MSPCHVLSLSTLSTRTTAKGWLINCRLMSMSPCLLTTNWRWQLLSMLNSIHSRRSVRNTRCIATNRYVPQWLPMPMCWPKRVRCTIVLRQWSAPRAWYVLHISCSDCLLRQQLSSRNRSNSAWILYIVHCRVGPTLLSSQRRSLRIKVLPPVVVNCHG